MKCNHCGRTEVCQGSYPEGCFLEHQIAKNERKKMEIIYFQPPGIRPQFCEVGMISQTDPEHIWYLNEPCKILISEVKIIPKENVTYDKKSRSYIVNQNEK